MVKNGFANDAADEKLPASLPDPHGQAAMLLVESLIHGLIAKSLLSRDEAVEIIEIASDVTMEIAKGAGKSEDAPNEPLVILTSITNSLKSGGA